MATTTHATTGTARRASHVLSGAGLVFRLNDEIDALQRDLASASGRRSAKTLAKTGGLRMTLVLLDSGATLDPEATAGGASVHVLEGHVRMQIDGQVRDAGAG